MSDEPSNRTNSTQPDQNVRRQNEGYDEAARGGKGVPPTDVGVPLDPDEPRGGDEFDQEAREAANDVRRREHSAD